MSLSQTKEGQVCRVKGLNGNFSPIELGLTNKATYIKEGYRVKE